MSTSKNSKDTFDKRPGTTDKGRNYEDFLTALLTLKLAINEEVEDFQLSSNDKDFGDFDDIVVNITHKNKAIEKYAIQLKHQQKTITKDRLASPEGDFSIQKYLSSYAKLKSKYCCVLYTCGSFKQEQGSKFKLKNENNLEISVFKSKKESFLNTAESQNVYRFEVEQGDKDIDGYNQFFQDFVFFPNQKNCDEIKTSINNLLKKEFCCDQTVSDSYINFIRTWSESNGRKEYLNKNLVIVNLEQLLLTPFRRKSLAFTEDTKLNLFRSAVSRYEITILQAEETSKEMFSQSIDTSEKKIVILEMVKCREALAYKSISFLLKNIKDKHFILIGKNIDRKKFSNVKVFENLEDLRQNSEIHEQFLMKTLSLQGRKPTPLSTIVQEAKETEKLFTTNKLIKILINDFKIGEGKEELPIPYIDQRLLKAIIKLEVLNNIRSSAICVLSHGGNIETVKDKIQVQVVSIEDYINKNQFGVIAEIHCSNEDFRKICQKNPSKKHHHFRLHQSLNLEWVASSGGIQDLLSFGVQLISVNESEIAVLSNDVNVICSQSGMGKTIMLKYLKNHLPSTHWVLYVGLREHYTVFNDFKEPEYLQKILQYLFEHQSKMCGYNAFEQKFRHNLVEKKRLIILWDGLDEVPDLAVIQKIVSSIRALAFSGFNSWITSRGYSPLLFHNEFPLLIDNLDKSQQENYIKNSLASEYTKRELKILVKKITTLLVATNSIELLGIPMQLFFLTELFRSNHGKYSKLIKKTFTLADMMRYFLKEKIIFGYRTNNIANEANPLLTKILREHRKYKTQHYEAIALQTYLEVDDFNNLPKIAFTAHELNHDDFGIVTNFGPKDVCSFFHNSCGEYFAAAWFARNFRNVPNFENFFFKERYRNIRRLFDIIMCKDCPVHLSVLYGNFGAIYNCSKKELNSVDQIGRTPLHLACSYGQSHPPLLIKKNDVDYIINFEKGDNVKEDGEEYKKIIKFLTDHSDLFLEDYFLHWDCRRYALETLSMFPFESILAKSSDAFGLLLKVYDIATLMFYSTKFSYRTIVKCFEQPVPYFESPHGCNLLHQISQWSNRSEFLHELFKNQDYTKNINNMNCEKRPFFIFFGRNLKLTGNKEVEMELVNTADGTQIVKVIRETPLHYASLLGDYKTVEVLVRYRPEINHLNNGSYTPLHYAVSSGRIDIVKLLVDNGAKLNMFDCYKRNELHYAVKAGSRELVQFLLEKGSVVSFDSEEFTPLGYAIKWEQSHLIETLFDATNFYCIFPDEYKYNALEAAFYFNKTNLFLYFLNRKVHAPFLQLAGAVRMKSLNLVQLFLHNGCNANASNETGTTSLHISSISYHKEIAKLLIDSGAKVNKGDTNGRTALHFAAVHGNIEMIKLLLESGAKIDTQDKLRQTPLQYAELCKQIKAVDVLIENGANDNKEDKNKIRPEIIRQLNIFHPQENVNTGENITTEIEWSFSSQFLGDPLERICNKGCYYAQFIPG